MIIAFVGCVSQRTDYLNPKSNIKAYQIPIYILKLITKQIFSQLILFYSKSGTSCAIFKIEGVLQTAKFQYLCLFLDWKSGMRNQKIMLISGALGNALYKYDSFQSCLNQFTLRFIKLQYAFPSWSLGTRGFLKKCKRRK